MVVIPSRANWFFTLMPTMRRSTKEATLLHTSSSIYWRTCAVFILLCFLGGGIVYTGAYNHIERQKQAALQLAGAASSSISQHLNASISAVYTLEVILGENQFKIDPQRFEIFASRLLEHQPGVSSLQYAPDGIVTYVVPLAGNESIIGHNLFDDPKRNKEAFIARQENRLMVAGPFDLIQGGVGLVARLPIYQADKTTETFWGFATVLIRLPLLLESAGVNSLLSKDYDWVLWRDHPDTGQPHIFAGTTDTLIDDAVQLTISVPNATWFLNIKPVQGWLSGHYPQIALGIGVFLIMSGVMSYALFLLQRQPFLLHQKVEERTRELLEANAKLLDSETRFRSINAQLDAQNKELEQVIYVTCHDLRSPLVTIEGFSEILENSLEEILSVLDSEGLSPDTKAKIASSIIDSRVSKGYIRKGVSKMTLLLKGLSQVSRAGKVELRREELDMNMLISGLIDEFEPRCKEQGGAIQVSDLPTCTADPGQTNQLFTNLIGNALKYADPHRPCRVKISGQKENSHTVYCVEDNGIGISPEHQQDIFEMFQQLDPEKEGEGLGLSIVRKIVERHNGKVWVESEVGEGSRFYVSL